MVPFKWSSRTVRIVHGDESSEPSSLHCVITGKFESRLLSPGQSRDGNLASYLSPLTPLGWGNQFVLALPMTHPSLPSRHQQVSKPWTFCFTSIRDCMRSGPCYQSLHHCSGPASLDHTHTTLQFSSLNYLKGETKHQTLHSYPPFLKMLSPEI